MSTAEMIQRDKWIAAGFSFISDGLDDAKLTCEEKRVYCHLLRLADNTNRAIDVSYKSIGDHCFSMEFKDATTRRKHAIAAIKELEEVGAITVTRRTGQGMMNLYRINLEWESNHE